MNRLQTKIGGPASSLDAASLSQHANASVQLIVPMLLKALEEQRAALRNAISATQPQPDRAFVVAHHIRAIAAPAGRPRLGELADCLARYITTCGDKQIECAAAVLLPLATAIDRAFDIDDADPLLDEVVAAARALIALSLD